ncbi:MAG: hypothetical protein J6J24_00625 [Clostridia bacterium]|nr:hypothetical protein [Clostridia bacterium]
MEYINKTIVTTKELYQEFSQSNIEEIFLNKKFISYVRQTTYGYYIEYKDELYTQNLSESEKKNTIMRGKIHATVTIKNGMLIKINRVISYKDKLTSETFDIYDTLKFSFFKPTIEHLDNLQNHCWTATHTQLSSTTKFVETLPSDYLVETLNFDGKNNGFVHNGKMLFLEDGSLFVYNLETAVSEKTINIKPKMDSLYSQYDFEYNIIYCYGNTLIFYTSRGKDTFNTHYINLATSEYEQLNFCDLYKIKFNGKYMSYFNRYSSRKTDVYNLEIMQYISFDNEALYLTADGQIFYEDWTANDALTLTDASNNTYRFEGKYVIHQQDGVVFTYGNGIVYKYINYVLVDQFECQLENEQTQSYVFNDTIFWNWTVFPVGISKDNNPNFLIPTYEAYCNHYLPRGLTFKILGLYGDKVLVRTEGYYGNYAMVYDLNRPLTPPIIIKNISIENNAAYVFTSDGALKISKANI